MESSVSELSSVPYTHDTWRATSQELRHEFVMIHGPLRSGRLLVFALLRDIVNISFRLPIGGCNYRLKI